MEGTRRQRQHRSAVVIQTLTTHRASRSLAGHCMCGFKIPDWETIEDHQGRMVCNVLFNTQVRDARATGPVQHEGGAENLALHRALGEAPCTACLQYLDDVLSERNGVRA